jgi:ubiquinone/menaquinone biosynthesis C-methylase UbiE
MKHILSQSGFLIQPSHRILDFGCGAGRMIRWLGDSVEGCEVWGVDIQSEHIMWCQQHLSPPFKFATVTTAPHLPFEDRYFDLIYCGSVFSHIDDLADACLLELKRILQPGGRLYITVHEKHSLQQYLTRIMHYAALFCTSGELTRADVPSGEIGVRQLVMQRVRG